MIEISTTQRKGVTMENPFDNPDIINTQAIEDMDDETVKTVWEILTRAGY
jgi:hypothetical protein